MNPEYNSGQSRFSDVDARLIELALGRRGELPAPPGWREELRRALRQFVAGTRDDDWDPLDREAALAVLSRPLVAPAAPAPSPVGGAELTACLEARQRARPGLAVPLCLRAAEAAPADWRPALALAELAVGERLEQRWPTALAMAHQRLDYATTPPPPGAWQLLTLLYQRTDSPTLAEAAAKHTGDAEVAAWAGRVRRDSGLPANAEALGVAPDREGDYVRAVQRALTGLRLGGSDAAQIEWVERDFPSLPGGPLLRCGLALKRARPAEAAAACERALALQEDCVPARYFAGAAAAQRAQWKPAAAHLRRAIELDPLQRGAWLLLGEVYRRSGHSSGAALAALAADYQKRFGEPLPGRRPAVP
jgi:tetratricopeptide (TPR) repeat protein